MFAGAIAPGSLAGRVQTIEFLPLSQAEIERRPPPRFLDAAFEGAVRPSDQAVVAFVLERTPGRIVGIEVKASATEFDRKTSRGCRGSRRRPATEFARGIVLHDGERVMSFGDRLAAAPVASL